MATCDMINYRVKKRSWVIRPPFRVWNVCHQRFRGFACKGG